MPVPAPPAAAHAALAAGDDDGDGLLGAVAEGRGPSEVSARVQLPLGDVTIETSMLLGDDTGTNRVDMLVNNLHGCPAPSGSTTDPAPALLLLVLALPL